MGALLTNLFISGASRIPGVYARHCNNRSAYLGAHTHTHTHRVRAASLPRCLALSLPRILVTAQRDKNTPAVSIVDNKRIYVL